MTYFMRDGNRFRVTTQSAVDLHELLPAATYTVKYNEMVGYWLEQIEDFELPEKLYGSIERDARRILTTFLSRPAGTGVLLAGEKGSGKTLTAKAVSIYGREIDVPTIVVNQPFFGEDFNSLIQMIEQPVIVLFDEFEKVYSMGGRPGYGQKETNEQQGLLTLLDGVYPSKKLYLLTANDRTQLDDHLRNRPGRIFYRFDYRGVSADFIREYCADQLAAEYQDRTEGIVRFSLVFSQFNFDILKAAVEEINRYGERPDEVMQVLNARPEFEEAASYDIELALGGGRQIARLGDHQWRGNPLMNPVGINYELDGEDDDDEYHRVTFRTQHLQGVDVSSGRFTYANENGDRLTLKKVQAAPVDVWSLF